MYINCAAIGQHTSPKQGKPRSSYKCCSAAAAFQNKLIISDYLHHLLPAISLEIYQEFTLLLSIP